MTSKRLLLITAIILSSLSVNAWKPWPLPMDSADTALDTLSYHGSWYGVASSGKYAPFWFSAGKDGAISFSPYSTGLRGGISKPATRPARWWDYSYGIDLAGGLCSSRMLPQAGCIVRDTPIYFGHIVELYAHARLWCFDFTVGWKPLDVGNQDNELSAGSLLFSHNAPTFPRISIGIDRYTPFPFTYGYLEVKANLTHGWMIDNIGVQHTMLHYKYIGVRLGGRLPVNISYEFHHAAQWGGTSDRYGDLGNGIRQWANIFRAGAGGVMANDQINAEGNHLGSQMLGIDVKWSGWKISAYWQNIFEDGPILPMWKTMNIHDGLWGLSIRQNKWPFVSAILYEFLNTTDQSGTAHDIDGMVFGGCDDYYRNSIYTQGWNHYRMTIGNPFITSPIYNTSLDDGTDNNRTFTHHIAICGDIYGFEYTARYNHSRNYGRYVRTDNTINNSILLEVEKRIPEAWNLTFGIAFGADIGNQFNKPYEPYRTKNCFGAMITIAKRGIIWKSKK